ncbi:MAG: hypothetical protein JSW09_11620 [Pseudomonadota bacterium]|nr:MAG: hypothetical protein JSW09_11620 [Pseudomonadota bacterium]
MAFWVSYATSQWHWFPRAGALIVSTGALLSTRRMIRLGLEGLIAGSSYFEIAHTVHSGSNGPDRETHRDLIAAYWGFAIVGFGTLVWAFGDLTECLLALSMVCAA